MSNITPTQPHCIIFYYYYYRRVVWPIHIIWSPKITDCLPNNLPSFWLIELVSLILIARHNNQEFVIIPINSLISTVVLFILLIFGCLSVQNDTLRGACR